MLALWYAEGPKDAKLPMHELARLADEVSGRLHSTPSFGGGAPLLDGVSCEPRYIAEGLSDRERGVFEEDVGEAGCVKAEGRTHVGLLGPKGSWDGSAASVLVKGDIIARDDPDLGLMDVQADEAKIREFLPISESRKDVLGRCCEHPSALMSFPAFGVQAFWVAVLNGSPDALDFAVGPKFGKSLLAMNYQHEDGLARTCLRVMSLIAAGNGNTVEGHRERNGPGPSDPPLCNRHGVPVMRAYLSNHTNDPHRLFWLRGERPTFLNVTRHEGRPAV